MADFSQGTDRALFFNHSQHLLFEILFIFRVKSKDKQGKK
jgi:hypothetical protein